jgi:hypothetical protein
MRNPFFITLVALMLMLIVSLAMVGLYSRRVIAARNGTSDNDTFRTSCGISACLARF